MIGALLLSAGLFVLSLVALGAHHPSYEETLAVRFDNPDGPCKELDEGDGIHLSFESEGPVDVVVIPRDDDMTWEEMIGGLRLSGTSGAQGAKATLVGVSEGDVEVEVDRGGTWCIIFFNSYSGRPVEVTYKVTYEIDSRTPMCALGGLVIFLPGAYLVGKRMAWKWLKKGRYYGEMKDHDDGLDETRENGHGVFPGQDRASAKEKGSDRTGRGSGGRSRKKKKL